MSQGLVRPAVVPRMGTALFPIGLGMALSLMGDATLYAVLPTHPAEAGIALESVGIVLSVNRLIRLGTNGPAGWLFDRVANRRALFVGSLWLGVFSTALYTLSQGMTLLFAARLLWGLAWSGIWVGGNGIVLELAPETQRGRWVGMYQVWFFTGSALGSFLGGLLTDAVGYRQALLIGAGISACGALVAMVAAAQRGRGRQPRAVIARSQTLGLTGWRSISPAMWVVASAYALNRLVTAGVVVATFGLVVQASFGKELVWGPWQIGVASMTGGLLASRTLISLFGAPLAGIWSDRGAIKFGVSSVRRRWTLLTISLVVGALGMGLLAVPGWMTVVAGTVLGAVANGSTQALTTTLAGDLADAKRHGANLGILFTAGDLGSAIGPLAAYALLPFGGLGVVYTGCAALLVTMGFINQRFSNALGRVSVDKVAT